MSIFKIITDASLSVLKEFSSCTRADNVSCTNIYQEMSDFPVQVPSIGVSNITFCRSLQTRPGANVEGDVSDVVVSIFDDTDSWMPYC